MNTVRDVIKILILLVPIRWGHDTALILHDVDLPDVT